MIRSNPNIDFLVVPLFKKSPLVTFLTHWLAWLLLHFITYIPSLINATKFLSDYFFFTHIVLSTISFLLFYMVTFYVMPHIGMTHKRWFWVVIASLLLAIVFTYFKFRVETYKASLYFDQLNNTIWKKFPKKPNHDSLGFFSYRFRTYFQTNILTNVSIIILAFAYRLLLVWFQQEKIRKELENQKLRAELSYLKMQVNPHFLFNALNNIYSLAVIEKSQRTGDSIMKLSDLMRYVLYEKEDDEHKVRLDNEIRHINSYIDLEKLRHEEDIYVSFSIEGYTHDKRIAPLLLFPLIENAFKHGLLTDAEKPVQTEIKVTDKFLDFSIQNYKNDYLKDRVGGIGIQNVRKRLDLIYGNSHTLAIRETEDQFFVNLHLPL